MNKLYFVFIFKFALGSVYASLGEKDFLVLRGDRIAQLVINKVYRPEFKLIDEKNYSYFNFKTQRDQNGFGHTGI